MKLRNIIIFLPVILSLTTLSFSDDGWYKSEYLPFLSENNTSMIDDSTLILAAVEYYYLLNIEVYNINKSPSELLIKFPAGQGELFAVSKPNNKIAVINWNGDLEIYDYKTGTLTDSMRFDDPGFGYQRNKLIGFDSSMSEIVTVDEDYYSINRWNLKTKNKLFEIELYDSYTRYNAQLSKFGAGKALLNFDDRVEIYDTKNGNLLSKIELKPNKFMEPKWSYDENNIIYIDDSSHIKSILISNGQTKYELIPVNKDNVYDFSETPDGKHLIVAYTDGHSTNKYLIWNIPELTIADSININSILINSRPQLKYISNNLTHLVFDIFNGYYCGYNSDDLKEADRVIIYNIKERKLIDQLPQGNIGENINNIFFNQSGNRLLFAGSDSIIAIWEPDSEKLLHIFSYHYEPNCFSNSGNEILFYQNDKIFVYSIPQEKYIDSMYIQINPQIIFNLPNDSLILTRLNRQIFIYNWLSKTYRDTILLDSLFPDTSGKLFLYKIKNSNSIVVASDKFEVVTIDLDSKQVLLKIQLTEPFEGGHEFCDISADGTRLLSIKDKNAFIWNIMNSELEYITYFGECILGNINFLNNNHNISLSNCLSYYDNHYNSFAINAINHLKVNLRGREPVIAPNGNYYASWNCPAFYNYTKLSDDFLIGVEDEDIQTIEANDFIIYDNTIKFRLNIPENVELSVYSYLGYLVFIQRIGLLSEGNHSIPFDEEKLPTGLYILRMKIDKEIIIKKLIIIK